MTTDQADHDDQPDRDSAPDLAEPVDPVEPSMFPTGPVGDDPPQTGDPVVDAALVDAASVRDAEPAEQLEKYVGTHRSLQDRLADSGA
jgi:hypothetical protein